MEDNREITNRFIDDQIDESVLKYIRDSVEVFENKLELAIAIYIKLAQLFWYSPSFIVNNDYSLVEDLSKISVVNTDVICLHWAVIYSKLLNIYGIENELSGDDEHLFVKISLNKFHIEADATSYGMDCKEYRLADLTNVKMGLKIENFRTISRVRNKELQSIINNVYEKLGIKYFDSSGIDEILKKFKKYMRRRLAKNILEGKHRINKEDILYRIRFINYFYKINIKLHMVERLQVFSKYYKDIFEGFNYDNNRCISLCEISDSSKQLRKLLVFKDDCDNIFYFFEHDDGFVEYEKHELLELFDKRNIGLKFDMCNILGFADDEIKVLSKKK